MLFAPLSLGIASQRMAVAMSIATKGKLAKAAVSALFDIPSDPFPENANCSTNTPTKVAAHISQRAFKICFCKSGLRFIRLQVDLLPVECQLTNFVEGFAGAV